VVLTAAQSDILATTLGEHQSCLCEPKLMATEQQREQQPAVPP